MTDLIFQDHSVVELDEFMGSDAKVVRAARASLKGAQRAVNHKDIEGLLTHMMRNRHGSVFEHGVFTFTVEAPKFVAWEFMRHRIASYNEISGRYAEMPPKFWVPPVDRKLRQEGKPAAYRLVHGRNPELDRRFVTAKLERQAHEGYQTYEDMLGWGIAREVARNVLPFNTFTSFFVTMNTRSLMNFLSLRIDHPLNTVETHPLAEIEEVAWEMERLFKQRMPITHKAWFDGGRVAP